MNHTELKQKVLSEPATQAAYQSMSAEFFLLTGKDGMRWRNHFGGIDLDDKRHRIK